MDRIAVLDVAAEEHFRNRVFDELLDGPFQRPGAIGKVRAFFDEDVVGGRRPVHGHAFFAEALGQVFEQDINDLAQVFLAAL